MSSILKALRKLEEEKAALGEGGVDISRDILKRSARKAPPNYWPILSAVLLTLLLGVGFFLWPDSRIALDSSVNTSVPSRRPEAIAPTVPAAGLAKLPEALSSAPLLASEPAEKIQAKSRQLQAGLPSESLETVSHSRVEPQALKPSGAPFLNLSGIVYRENVEERIAIINDLPVMKGTAIEGAQLIEIRSDSVVLIWKGSLFHLPLGELR